MRFHLLFQKQKCRPSHKIQVPPFYLFILGVKSELPVVVEHLPHVTDCLSCKASTGFKVLQGWAAENCGNQLPVMVVRGYVELWLRVFMCAAEYIYLKQY